MAKSYLFAIVSIAIIVLTGCSGRENKVVRNDLLAMDFATLDEFVKSASPKAKAEFWTIKLQDVMSNGDLSEEEKQIVKEFYSKLTPEAYTLGTQEQQDIQAFSEEIESILTDRFGWDEKKLYHYFGIILTEAEILEYNKKHGTDF